MKTFGQRERNDCFSGTKGKSNSSNFRPACGNNRPPHMALPHMPDEYTGSRYTHTLKGANAKAKANALQGIPETLEIAAGKHFRENMGEKYRRNAANGWYRYGSHFALPVYADDGEVERYNVFHASMLKDKFNIFFT